MDVSLLVVRVEGQIEINTTTKKGAAEPWLLRSVHDVRMGLRMRHPEHLLLRRGLAEHQQPAARPAGTVITLHVLTLCDATALNPHAS